MYVDGSVCVLLVCFWDPASGSAAMRCDAMRLHICGSFRALFDLRNSLFVCSLVCVVCVLPFSCCFYKEIPQFLAALMPGILSPLTLSLPLTLSVFYVDL